MERQIKNTLPTTHVSPAGVDPHPFTLLMGVGLTGGEWVGVGFSAWELLYV